MSSQNPTGKTKSQGWQVGVSRTLPVSEQAAWQKVLSVLSLDWQNTAKADYKKGDTLVTADNTQVEIRSYEHGALIRMKWQPKGWSSNSTLQVRVRPAKTGTTISVHHEWLQNAEQREAMRRHWTNLLEELKADLA
ncbi:MAG: SRPBCC domain-containing protein [Anaerolineaceae bacterium]|nr:SRPBCC domain-containing protein [Anaerolineaceae bacterium]